MSTTEKEIIRYFRNNIFEAYDSYCAWKMIYHVRSKDIVALEMAERYVSIQKQYHCFFISTERAHLIRFVTLACHPFDKRKDTLSLDKLDKKKTEEFEKNNKKVIESLLAVRHNVFAHRNEKIEQGFDLPSINDLDEYFTNLFKFYNSITSEKEDSMTLFDGADDVKRDMENIYMNLERGEAARLKEIDIKLMWEENKKKGSDVL